MGQGEHVDTKNMNIPPYTIKNWKGLNTAVKDSRFLDRGETSDSLNWITGRKGDHIELRRGQALLGTNRREISGNSTKVTGIGTGTKINGTEIPFFTAGRSIYHYDVDTDLTVEDTVANIMPTLADGEDTSINPYTNLAGSFVYVTSKNSGHYKIPVANPSDAVDQKIQNHRFGFAKINRNRMYGMDRKGLIGTSFDATGVYLSWVDKQSYSDYPAQQTNLPQFSGDSATKTFSGSSLVGAYTPGVVTYFSVIMAAPIATGTAITGISKASSAVVTVASHSLVAGDLVMILSAGGMTEINGIITSVVEVTATTITISVDSTSFSTWTSAGSIYECEVFNDDRSGIMNSNLGGTGTINYSTGAWSLTFNTAPISGSNNGIANNNYERSASEGILDFSYNATSRVPGTGNLFRQDDGGGVGQAIWPYQGVEYCFHKLKSWVLNSLDTTDTLTSNLPYYEQIGVPYPRAVFPTSDGIIYLDNSNPAQPKVAVLQIPPGSTNLTVVPIQLSSDLDLSGFAYDYAVIRRWSEYDIMECQNYTNGVKDTYNSVTFIRNIYSGIWNKLDYAFTCLDEYNGTLIAGDSLSPNLYTLFSGFDDEGQVIPNYWKSGYVDFDIEGLKKVGYINVQGLIQQAQSLEISISLDQGEYSLAYTILGDGEYVAQSNPVGVGSFTAGSNVVGGGGTVFANPFEIDIPLHTDKFEFISFKIEAIGVGYVQVDNISWKDIRWKRKRLLSYQDTEI